MRVETLDRLRDLGFPTYADYLASDLWRTNKRRLGLAKSCWSCKATRELHAHHCSYDDVGDEQPGDLIVLCSRCHSRVHELVNDGALLLTAHFGLMRVVRLPDGQPKRRKKNKSRKHVAREQRSAINGPHVLKPEVDLDQAKITHQKTPKKTPARATIIKPLDKFSMRSEQSRLDHDAEAFDARVRDAMSTRPQRDRLLPAPSSERILTTSERRKIRRMVETARAERDRKALMERRKPPQAGVG